VVAWSLQLISSHAGKYTQVRLSLSRLNGLDACVLAWALIGLASLAWTQRLEPATTELRTIIIQPVIFYLMLRTIKLRNAQVVLLVDALVISSIAVAVIGLFQFVNGDAIITAEDGARRLASVYGSPNNVGLLMGRSIPFVVAFILVGIHGFRRTASVVAMIPLSLTAILTQSVGALFIGIPVAITTVMLVIYRRRSLLPLFAFIIIGVFLFFVASQVSPRFERALDMTQGTNFYRLRVWESAANIIRDYPIKGIGLDQFLYEFRDTYILPDAWEEPNLSHPHNFILDIWTRLGLAGLITFGAIIVFFWKNITEGIAGISSGLKENRLIFAIIAGASGSMANLLAHGMVDNSIFVIDLAYIFMLLLGLSILTKNTGAIDSEN
jgi:O-antigen ligase